MPYRLKEEQQEYQRAWRAERRLRLAKLKEGSCADCGNKYPYYVMDFDHKDEEKARGIAQMVIHNKWSNVIKEVAKCDVVCANCHRIRTHKANHHIARKWRN
jgi:hypothetical protein